MAAEYLNRNGLVSVILDEKQRLEKKVFFKYLKAEVDG